MNLETNSIYVLLRIRANEVRVLENNFKMFVRNQTVNVRMVLKVFKVEMFVSVLNLDPV